MISRNQSTDLHQKAGSYNYAIISKSSTHPCSMPITLLWRHNAISNSPVYRPSGARRSNSPVHRPSGRSNSPVHRPSGRSNSPVHRPSGRSNSPVHRPSGRSNSPVHRPSGARRSPVWGLGGWSATRAGSPGRPWCHWETGAPPAPAGRSSSPASAAPAASNDVTGGGTVTSSSGRPQQFSGLSSTCRVKWRHWWGTVTSSSGRPQQFSGLSSTCRVKWRHWWGNGHLQLRQATAVLRPQQHLPRQMTSLVGERSPPAPAVRSSSPASAAPAASNDVTGGGTVTSSPVRPRSQQHLP